MDFKKFKAVYIDDEPINLMLVQAYASQFDLDIECFESSPEALEYILHHDIDILFTDYMMPDIDGLEVIKQYRKINSNIPIVVITAAGDDQELKLSCLEAGATDFLSKPIELTEFKARTSNLLHLRHAQMMLEDQALHLQEEVDKATKEIVHREHEALDVLTKAAEYKNPETANHVARVAHYSRLIARNYGLEEKEQDAIFYVAPFHDIGKVGIPDNILLKKGKLDFEENKIMQTHTTIGYEILKDAKGKYLAQGAIVSLNHHEKYDGTGYPNKIKGEDIPLNARIVSIADVFDALTSERPYKKAWSLDDALNLLIRERGKFFDPALVDIFTQSLDEIKKIHDHFKE
ncbi:MAG: response regulator [Campylobacterota bacterium]|nr:response regulator [Campylobacterota bacterium]